MVCANAGYLLYYQSNHWWTMVCYGAEYFSVLKRQVPNDFFTWQQKTWERPPIRRWESGLLRLYIAPISANLRLYDTCGAYRRQCARNQTAENQKRTNENNKLRKALRMATKRSRENTRVTVRWRHWQVGTHTRHMLLLAMLDLTVTPPAIEVIWWLPLQA